MSTGKDSRSERGPDRSKGPRVIFFVSSGRCGTQRIAQMLADCYADHAVARHEPIEMAWAPRRFLRREDLELQLAEEPAIRDHLAWIDRILAGGGRYIETGWPALGWIPLLEKRYRSADFAVVHLVRHPVPTALSLSTHGLYALESARAALAELCPQDSGTRFGDEYRIRWSELSRVEKCLFQWLEIHAYALELEEILVGTPWLRVRFEELFAPGPPSEDTLRRLLDFLALPVRAESIEAMRVPFDRFRATSPDLEFWRIGSAPPHVEALCERLGYAFGQVDPAELRERYAERTARRASRRRIARRIRDLLRGW